jgi:NHL repeat/WD40-like Beta Propeller Repeat
VLHRRLGNDASFGSKAAQRGRTLLALWCIFAGALLASSAPALAGHIHVFERKIGEQGVGIGQFETPVAAAVNDTSGDIYVADKNNNRVEIFNSEGAFLSLFDGSEAPTAAFSDPDQIAVDNSGKTPLEDPSVQDVYVYDSGHQVIDKFDPEGKYLGQILEAEPGSTFAEGLFGIAVDANGVLWVVRRTTELPEVDSFSNAESNAFLSKRSVPSASRGFAVDSHENLYVNRGDETFRKFNEAGEELIERMDSEQSTAAAVDLSNDDVYIYNQTSAENAIAVFGPALVCTVPKPCAETPLEELLERFGAEFGAGEHLPQGRGLAVNSSNKTAYAVATAANELVAFNALTVPDVDTEAATSLTPTSATLNGNVNPEGIAVSDCHFEYGESTSYGKLAPCSPAPGEGEEPVAVSANIALSSSITHFRLVASNKNGSSHGIDRQLRAPGPGLHGASVTEVTSESATFHATIDPNSAPTSYFFQYGTSSAYGESVPVPPVFLGEGSGDQQSEPEPVSHLLASTTYHYRVVAISETSPGHSEQFPGPDQTFITNASANATSASAALPDGRQWELVSPVDKHGALIEAINETGVIEAAASGDAISYLANGPTEGEPQGYSNYVQVLSRRLSGGWASKDIATPHEAPTGASVGTGQEYRFFTSDLSESIVQPMGGFVALSPAASEQTPYLRADFPAGNVGEACEPSKSSCYRPLVSGCPASGPCAKAIEEEADVPAGTVFANNRKDGPCADEIFRLAEFSCRPLIVGATPDGSHIVIESQVGLALGSGSGMYEWSGGGQLAYIGGGVAHIGSGTFHAISEDGARVVLDGEAQGLSGLLVSNALKGAAVKLDQAEAGCGTCASGGGEFALATPDAKRVLFTDTRRLTSDAGAEAGAPDLYECQIFEGPGSLECALTDITPAGGGGEAANAQGVLGASEDGSYLYYAAGPTSEPHVYLRHGGTSSLIGVLSLNDSSDWVTEQRHHTARVSPNGQWLAFLSQEPLTGYDTHDAVSGKLDMEVYLYGASAKRLVCASCDPSGARPAGIEYNKIISPNGGLAGGDRILVSLEQGVAAIIPGGTPVSNQIGALYQSRYLSNSGRLFFNSQDALVPQDVNSTMDVYEYEPVGVPAGSPTACSTADASFSAKSGGCASLISAGTSPLESAFLDASESGSDVFFLTSSRLDPQQDIDGERDVYDAHECSASAPCFATLPESASACVTGESCKAAPTPQPEIFGAPASATFAGAGNPPPPAPPAAVKPKPPTRAQLLAKALKACQKKAKAKRKSCQAAARKRYGPKAKSKSKRKATHRKGH